MKCQNASSLSTPRPVDFLATLAMLVTPLSAKSPDRKIETCATRCNLPGQRVSKPRAPCDFLTYRHLPADNSQQRTYVFLPRARKPCGARPSGWLHTAPPCDSQENTQHVPQVGNVAALSVCCYRLSQSAPQRYGSTGSAGTRVVVLSSKPLDPGPPKTNRALAKWHRKAIRGNTAQAGRANGLADAGLPEYGEMLAGHQTGKRQKWIPSVMCRDHVRFRRLPSSNHKDPASKCDQGQENMSLFRGFTHRILASGQRR